MNELTTKWGPTQIDDKFSPVNISMYILYLIFLTYTYPPYMNYIINSGEATLLFIQ